MSANSVVCVRGERDLHRNLCAVRKLGERRRHQNLTCPSAENLTRERAVLQLERGPGSVTEKHQCRSCPSAPFECELTFPPWQVALQAAERQSCPSTGLLGQNLPRISRQFGSLSWFCQVLTKQGLVHLDVCVAPLDGRARTRSRAAICDGEEALPTEQWHSLSCLLGKSLPLCRDSQTLIPRCFAPREEKVGHLPPVSR